MSQQPRRGNRPCCMEAMMKKKTLTLVVSKNDIGFKRLSRVLATEVLRASSVVEARDTIKSHAPSCVIMDFTVGKEDALSLYQELGRRFFGVISVGCLDTLEKLVACSN